VNLTRRRGASAAFFFLIGTAVLIAPPGMLVRLEAQNLGQRSVSGAVVDDKSEPVSGATVFLRNEKTKSIRSYTSTQDGRFRFAQVNMSEDYDLWAEKNNRKTAVKTVSSWDARKEFETELKFK
jgi:hypothetical protein